MEQQSTAGKNEGSYLSRIFSIKPLRAASASAFEILETTLSLPAPVRPWPEHSSPRRSSVLRSRRAGFVAGEVALPDGEFTTT